MLAFALMKWSSSILGVSAVVFAISVAAAQNAGPPPAPKNLQVLPKDIPRPQLMGVMKGFATALGVRCTHCHVGQEGQPATFDFASDAKKEKLTARAMLRMIHRINEQDFHVTDVSKVKVTCFTCHRGSTKPLTAPLPAVPAITPAAAQPPERG